MEWYSVKHGENFALYHRHV